MAVNKLSKQYPMSIDELCETQLKTGKFEHLRIILSKNDNHQFGQDYLYISKSSFGKVKLIDLDFRDGHLYIELQDCTNGMFIHKSSDINDTDFDFFLVSWIDIRKMVNQESVLNISADDLLELEA